MRITSRLEAEQVWILGRNGASRPGIPRGVLRNAVEDGRLLVLQFFCDGKRLERTPAWQNAGEVLGSAVAAFVQKTVTSRDALLLSIGGPSSEKRRLGGRAVELSSAEHIFLDYALAGRSESFTFVERRGADYRQSVLLIQPARRDVAAMLRASWGWGTVCAYVVPRSKLELAMKAWRKLDDTASQREIATLSRYATIACEEWADGGALRFWSTELSHAQVAKRLGRDVDL